MRQTARQTDADENPTGPRLTGVGGGDGRPPASLRPFLEVCREALEALTDPYLGETEDRAQATVEKLIEILKTWEV